MTIPDAYGRVDLPADVEVIPTTVGAYYSNELRDFKHYDYTVGRSKLEIPVGRVTAAHFNEVFSAMFAGTFEVNRRPPYAAGVTASNLSAVIEVRIEDFVYDWRPLSTGPFTANVRYRFIVYAPNGQTIASWTESGTDTAKLGFTEHATPFTAERTNKAIRQASSKLMEDFQSQPGVDRWLASLDDPAKASPSLAAATVAADTSEKAPERLDDIKVQGMLYSQHGLQRVPYHSTDVRAQVLAAHVVIENKSSRSIVVRPSDVTLSPRHGRWLEPGSTNQIARRIYQAPQVETSEVLGSAFLTLAEGSAKDRQVQGIANAVRSSLLRDTTLAPGASTSGSVYFEALGIDGKFDKAVLRVRVGETSTSQNYDAAIWVGQGPAAVSGLTLASLGAAGAVAAGQASAGSQPPVQQTEIAKPEQVEIALLPADGWALAGASTSPNTESRIHKFARKFLTDMDVSMVDRSGEESRYRGKLWTGSGSNKQLNTLFAIGEGNRLGVDGVLTFKYIVRGIGGSYTVDIDVALVDVTTGQVHSRSGRSNDTKANTEMVVLTFIESQRAVVAVTNQPPAAHQVPVATGVAAVAQTQSKKLVARSDKREHIRVGILAPGFNRPTSPTNSDLEEQLQTEILRYLGSNPAYDMSYNYAARAGVGYASSGPVWIGNAVKKTPDKEQLRRIGEDLEVDCLVLGWIMNTWGGSKADLYVYSVGEDRMHQSTIVFQRARGAVDAPMSRCRKPT